MFVSADFSQLEWRVAAELSQDKVMKEEIEQNVDIHTRTVEDIFEGKAERRIAKVFSFRMIYGGSAYSFYMDANMPSWSKKDWENTVEAFYDKYSGLREWHESLQQEATRTKALRIPQTGQVWKFSDPEKDYAKIVNYPVQGTAGVINEVAGVALLRRTKELESKLNLNIHDDWIFDCPLEECYTVSTTLLKTMRETPQLFEQLFGYEWTTPIDAEAAVGYTLGDTIELMEHEDKELEREAWELAYYIQDKKRQDGEFNAEELSKDEVYVLREVYGDDWKEELGVN